MIALRKSEWFSIERLCAVDLRVPSGGGISSVTTDGVTIQGIGTVGSPIALKQVETDASLIGAGIVGNTLKVAPNIYYTFGLSGSTATATANKTWYAGFALPAPLTFGNIGVRVLAADGTHLSDLGIYNAAGTLVAHTGALNFGSAAWVNTAIVGGAITVQAGNYLFAFTSNNNVFAIQTGFVGTPWAFNAAADTTAGGVLPNTIVAPSLTPIDQVTPRVALF